MRQFLSRQSEVFFLLTFLAMAWALWLGSAELTARWAGVPPVPTRDGAIMGALGDVELAFRSNALELQNLGDGGGETTPLKSYDYARLGQWFDLLDSLDPASDHPLFLAAYYFGATQVPGDVGYIVDYLVRAGDNPAGDKWRWLAHAAYLKRYRMDDLSGALDIAYKLSRMQLVDERMPIWARQMPAFILHAQGQESGARDLIEKMIVSDNNINPADLNFLHAYLSEQLHLPPAEIEKVMKLREGAASEGKTN